MINRNLNFLRLPHVNTLKKYLNFTTPKSGFDPVIIQRLVEDSKVEDLDDPFKSVSVIYDEMKIKSDLVFRQGTGQLVGFTEMGDINEEFRAFERRVEESSDSVAPRDFATYVIVFMVRGIVSSFVYPFGYFASLGFTADQLYPCVWEAARVLEAVGFKVRAFISDGASPNRKFYRIITTNDIFWAPSLFSDNRKIYVFSDFIHLIKTTRNCLENSHDNKNTRNMHVSNYPIFYCKLIFILYLKISSYLYFKIF